MATQVQLRGGTAAQHASFVGANREVTVDTTNKTLRIHDGSTAGGFKLLTAGGTVVIFGTGQSNFVRESLLTNPWVPPGNLLIWNSTSEDAGDAFEAPTTTNMNTLWAFGARLADMFPTLEFRVIPVAEGGLPISNWLTGAPTTDMFAASQDAVTAALAALGKSKIDIFCWWQGENNRTDQSTYESDWETMIARYRTQSWFDQNTPTVIFGIADETIGGNDNFRTMNMTLQRVADVDPDNRIFTYSANAPASLWADTFHPTGDGYAYVGRLAADNFLGRNGRRGPWHYDDDEPREIVRRVDQNAETRVRISNFSTGGSARSVLIVEGDAGAWSVRTGSASTGAMGYTGASGWYLDAEASAFIGFRFNSTQSARFTSAGLKVGGAAVSDNPVTDNSLGFVISPTLGALFSTDASGPMALNRTTSGTLVGFRLAAVVVGSIGVAGSTTTYNTSSDYRLPWKAGYVPLENSGEFIDNLKPYYFPEVGHAGFIAHEFQEVSPCSVVGEKDAVDEDGNPEMQAMQASTPDVMANVVAELQALRLRMSAAEAEIADLKERIAA